MKILRIIFLWALLLSSGLTYATNKLTIIQCREKALKNNKNIQIAYENQQIALNNKKASFSYFFPAINLMADYTRFNKTIKYDLELDLKDKMTQFLNGMAVTNPAVTTDPFFQTLSQMGSALPEKIGLSLGEKNNYLGTISFTQPIFTGGKILQQYKISKDLEDISHEQFRISEEEVIEKTDEYYYKLVTLKEKKELATRYHEMIQSHLHDLINMKEAGLVTDNEVLKVKVKLNEAELNLFKAQNGCLLARMALNQIIGNPLNQDIDTDESINSIQQFPNIDTEQAIAKRSEIKMLEKALKISKSLVNISRSSYMPNIVLQSNYSLINPNPFNSMQKEFGDSWQISIIGQWELFHANERYYHLSQAKHVYRSAQLKLEDSKELINLDIEQNKIKLAEAIKRIEMCEAGVKQAEDNLRVCNDKFKEGLISASEVLDAQTLWTQTLSSKIEAVSDYHLNVTKYQKALGLLNTTKTGE